MRSELNESGSGYLPRRKRESIALPLEASAVDAALSDETTPEAAPTTVRREMRSSNTTEATRRAIDSSHAADGGGEPADGELLRMLSRQLSMLETQQAQIRQLLEQTERRRGAAADAR